MFSQCSVLASAQSPTPSPDNKPSEGDLVHFGDLVDVDVVGSFEYDWSGTLTPEGFLDGLDKIEERIYALCRSEADIAADIQREYGKMLRAPRVVVKILDRSNRAVAILQGAVKTPHRFQVKRPVFLNELIILSGGIIDRANGEIQIFRPENLSCAAENKAQTPDAKNTTPDEMFVRASKGNGTRIFNITIFDLLRGVKEANPQIVSGDIITVLEALPIYVIGGVNEPQQISSRSQTTLSRAIATAGGLAKEADGGKVTIFRRVGIETKIIEADLEKIASNQAEDIKLQASDIVDVPQKGRQKRRFPPLVRTGDDDERGPAILPLRIIE